MKYDLTATEARVIGCLLEKQVTTPEQYPLSVNDHSGRPGQSCPLLTAEAPLGRMRCHL